MPEFRVHSCGIGNGTYNAGVKKPPLNLSLLASVTLATLGSLPATAQLPSLNEQPWLGHHTAFSSNKFRFGVTSDGKIKLTPMLGKDKPIGIKMEIEIEVLIESTNPNGRSIARKIIPATLASPQAPNADFEKTTITGKVTGDASFELTLEQKRDVISIGGRITDPGKLTGPLNFSIRCDIPDPYYSAKQRADKDKRKAENAFERTIKGDRISLTLADKSRKKLKLDDKIGNSNPDLDKPGITEAEVEISSYKGRKFIFSTTPETPMKLWNPAQRPLHEGFSILWSPDPAKNPDGKARLSIDVK